MFTGLVEEIGTVKNITQNANKFTLEIAAQKVLSDLKIGDSIAVNGICLTVTEFTDNSFSVEAAPVTLQKSSLRNISSGAKVNLERALQLQERLGGHLVTGHINTTASINFIQQTGNAYLVQLNTSHTKYLVTEGSVCVDGISLTVAEVEAHGFTVSVIPHTWQTTTLRYRKIGDVVNLEFDIIAKYTEKLLQSSNSKIDQKFLSKNGF